MHAGWSPSPLGRGSLRPPAASRCCVRKLTTRSFPRRPPAKGAIAHGDPLDRDVRAWPTTTCRCQHPPKTALAKEHDRRDHASSPKLRLPKTSLAKDRASGSVRLLKTSLAEDRAGQRPRQPNAALAVEWCFDPYGKQ